MVNSNVRFELLQKVVQYEKVAEQSLKVQNCSKVLAGGHVRGYTKTQFTHMNIQTLHVNTSTLFLRKYATKLPELISCLVRRYYS